MTVWRKLEPLYITGENVNGVVVKGLNSFGSSKSKNLPNDLAIPLPGINPTEVKTGTQVLYASVRISIIHCLKGGNNRVHSHINEWTKWGISIQWNINQPWEGWNSDTCYNMDEPLKRCAATSCQSCPTLCHPIDSSPPGSSVPGILQARTLEWVAISFSNAWKWKWSRSVVSHS